LLQLQPKEEGLKSIKLFKRASNNIKPFCHTLQLKFISLDMS